MIYDHHVTNKLLFCYSNYIVDVAMWPRFGNHAEVFKSWRILFNFLKILKALLNYVYLILCDFEYLTLRCNARRPGQPLSAKMATLGLLKVKILRSKDYDAIISVHDVNNKILLCYSNYIVDGAMWPKFGNSSISIGEVIITLIL